MSLDLKHTHCQKLLPFEIWHCVSDDFGICNSFGELHRTLCKGFIACLAHVCLWVREWLRRYLDGRFKLFDMKGMAVAIDFPYFPV